MKDFSRIWASDFETTTYDYDNEKTNVWLAYMKTIDGENEVMFDDENLTDQLPAFFNWLEQFKKPQLFYFHNLSWDGDFLLHYLAKNYTPVTDVINDKGFNIQTKLPPNHFKFQQDAISNIYSINFRTNNNIMIRFQCSYKLIPTSVASMLGKRVTEDKEKIDYNKVEYNENTRKYIRTDVEAMIPFIKETYNNYNKVKLTISSTAYKELQQNSLIDWKNNYEDQFDINDWNFLNQWYNGAWTYTRKIEPYSKEWFKTLLTRKRKIWKNIFYFDVNSLYPHIFRNYKLPYGKPIYGCKTNCKHELILYKVNITAKIKENGVPFIPATRELDRTRDYLKECKNHFIFVTNAMLDLIYELYDVFECKIMFQICFNHNQNNFNTFFDKYQTLKQQAKKDNDPVKYQLYKLPQNAVYGKTAQKSMRKKYFLRKPINNYETKMISTKMYGDYVLDYQEEEATKNLSYIPLGIFITSFAKILTITLANKYGKYWLTSDTDSCVFSFPKNFKYDIDVDSYQLGKWDLENQYNYAIIMNRKQYVLGNELNDHPKKIAWCGANIKQLYQYKFKDFLSLDVKIYKKQKKRLNGGLVLVEKQIFKKRKI